MTENFTQRGKSIINASKKIAKEMECSAGSEHLLLALLSVKNTVAYNILSTKKINITKIKERIELLKSEYNKDKVNSFTPMFERIIENAEVLADKNNKNIGTEHLLQALIEEENSLGTKLLIEQNVRLGSIKNEIDILLGEVVRRNNIPVTNYDAKGKSESFLEKFTKDYTAMALNGEFDPLLGREEELSRIMQILSRRSKNNPALIGEPGVGKSAIVEGLAQKIAFYEVPENLKDKRILMLDITGLVSGTRFRGDFEEKIKKVINEVVAAGNIILFIDEMHTIIGAGGGEGSLDVSNVLKPELSRGKIQLIGATTTDEYKKRIEKDSALERRFQSIMIEEPTQEETKIMLYGLKSKYEEHHKIEIPNNVVDFIVKSAHRYIQDRFLPDKAIDLMDESAAIARLESLVLPENIRNMEAEYQERIEEIDALLAVGDYEKAKTLNTKQNDLKKKIEKEKTRWGKINLKNLVLTEDSVAEVVASWTGIPIKNIEEDDIKRLLNLEDELHKSVIGQDEAITKIAKAIKRSRVGLKDPNRPMGTFLFLGPTGVGKTELTKVLTENLFGSTDSLIRVDMSEYMEKHSVSKIMGSPPGYVGYEEGGQLSEQVRRKPYSVLLFDEIEKAHPDFTNVLLQVLDEGHITDAKGRKVDFKNTIIIMTSNVGGKNIVEPKNLGFIQNESAEVDYKNMKSKVMNELKRTFKPEFINRIDDVVVFHPLSMEDINGISKLLLNDLVARAKENARLDITYSKEVVEYISTKGYSKIYGARPIKRTIREEIEDKLSEEILKNSFKNGKVCIYFEDEIKFK
ncbi:MAG: ATP-dependent Clp protease ATP-binding subunit [Lachnospirales bacterium]